MTDPRKTHEPDPTPSDERPTAPRPRDGTPPQRRAEQHDDNALESIGKAVSEPVRDAADPDADEKPDAGR